MARLGRMVIAPEAEREIEWVQLLLYKRSIDNLPPGEFKSRFHVADSTSRDPPRHNEWVQLLIRNRAKPYFSLESIDRVYAWFNQNEPNSHRQLAKVAFKWFPSHLENYKLLLDGLLRLWSYCHQALQYVHTALLVRNLPNHL
jgi:hypothetical protein